MWMGWNVVVDLWSPFVAQNSLVASTSSTVEQRKLIAEQDKVYNESLMANKGKHSPWKRCVLQNFVCIREQNQLEEVVILVQCVRTRPSIKVTQVITYAAYQYLYGNFKSSELCAQLQINNVRDKGGLCQQLCLRWLAGDSGVHKGCMLQCLDALWISSRNRGMHQYLRIPCTTFASQQMHCIS